MNNKTGKIVNVVLALFVIAVPFRLFAENPKKIKIGVSTALTGGAATWGVDAKNVIEFAIKKLGRDRYELLFQDDKCEGKEAATVAQHFVAIDKVPYVLGLVCSGAALSAAPIYERSKTVAMVVSASAAEIADAGDYIFRLTPSDEKAGALLAREMGARFKRIGIISELTEYAQSFERSFRKAAPSSLEIVAVSFQPKSSDFRALLEKLRAQKIEALFINPQAEDAFLLIAKQIHSLKWQLPWYGAYWPGSNTLQEAIPQLLEGVRFVDLPSAESLLSPDGMKTFQEFVAEYGKLHSVELVFASAFEAVRALLQADQSGQDPREYLYHTTFHGLIGDWHFDRKGEIQGLGFALKEIKNGKSIQLSLEK